MEKSKGTQTEKSVQLKSKLMMCLLFIYQSNCPQQLIQAFYLQIFGTFTTVNSIKTLNVWLDNIFGPKLTSLLEHPPPLPEPNHKTLSHSHKLKWYWKDLIYDYMREWWQNYSSTGFSKKLIPATFPDLVTLECGKYAVRRGDSTAHPHSHMLERVSWR
jgi:hypothetical protein